MKLVEVMEKEASHLEKEHVHNVYEKIAPYFNDKRYKAWPRVQAFLLAQEPGSLIADIGCGNGKYLHINSQAFKVGCDYSFSLAEAARNRGYEVLVCDGLKLPYRDGCFDAVLSIAVIHHFSTKERRIRALKEMARILKVGGQMMIYVWAMEQKRRKFEKQDLLIPWNMETSIQNISDKLHSSMDPSFKNLPLNGPFIRSNTTIKPKTKSSLFVGETQSLQNGLYSSRFLARSLESGLDRKLKCVDSDRKHPSIIHRLYDYCIEIKNLTNTYQSKPSYLLESLGDFLPSHMQNFEHNKNKGTELLLFSLTNMHFRKSSNAEPGKEIIESLNKVPLPDLGSIGNELVDIKHFTSKYADTPESSENNKDESSLISDCDEKVSQCHQALPDEYNGWLRYYHIFKQGELSDLIEQHVPELHVVRTFFDHSNWCVIAEKTQLWNI
ncbi:probable tRNA methyltransferase 9B [Pseudophryne corroboree]|uniref:probable tRNA methyltransferase 9B n=1 Tax=Pseudophryne corroboree TaxID=495146 RepID=UPI00308183E2